MKTGWGARAGVWTDENVEKLKTLWLEGRSCSQIAVELRGGFTRNAVIGKLTRLGLSGRPKPSRPATVRAPKPPRPPSAPRPVVVALPRPAPAIAPPEPVPLRCEPAGSATLLTLTSHMCKWPIGDPASASLTFCGSRATQGVYCASHAALAFQPTSERRTRDMVRSLRRFL